MLHDSVDFLERWNRVFRSFRDLGTRTLSYVLESEVVTFDRPRIGEAVLVIFNGYGRLGRLVKTTRNLDIVDARFVL